MVAKSKTLRKKNRVSKHVLKAREKVDQTQDGATLQDEQAKAGTEVPSNQKNGKKPKAKAHQKDPSDVSNYLIMWEQHKLHGHSGWKFNKNTQSWLIRHMYDTEKIPKATFERLVSYLEGLSGTELKDRIVLDASRRAVRYKQYQATSDEAKDAQSLSRANAKKNSKHFEDDARFQLLSDHDKRKEYKRARKILDCLKRCDPGKKDDDAE